MQATTFASAQGASGEIWLGETGSAGGVVRWEEYGQPGGVGVARASIGYTLVELVGRGEAIPERVEWQHSRDGGYRVESLEDLARRLLAEVGAPVVHVEVRYSREAGLYVLAIVDADMRLALDYWLKVSREAGALGVPVFVVWTGRANVSPEEAGLLLGRILARMNVFPATRRPLDAARLLRGEW